MATSWNITLNDTSPVFTYYPYCEPFIYNDDRLIRVMLSIDDGFGLTNGWQVWYSETGYNTAPANAGFGISAHITSLSGANVTLPFYGTLDLMGHTSL